MGTALTSKYEVNCLTNQEFIIVVYRLMGYTRKEIGNMMFITEGTVKSHLKNVYSKFDLRNDIELSNWFYLREVGLNLKIYLHDRISINNSRQRGA